MAGPPQPAHPSSHLPGFHPSCARAAVGNHAQALSAPLSVLWVTSLGTELLGLLAVPGPDLKSWADPSAQLAPAASSGLPGPLAQRGGSTWFTPWLGWFSQGGRRQGGWGLEEGDREVGRVGCPGLCSQHRGPRGVKGQGGRVLHTTWAHHSHRRGRTESTGSQAARPRPTAGVARACFSCSMCCLFPMGPQDTE